LTCLLQPLSLVWVWLYLVLVTVILLILVILAWNTLTTAESFDNLLGSNNFSCEWTSYFFYDRRGNLSLTTSGYCFKNWPTDDILLAFNQNKELFVTECCFVEELKMFGLSPFMSDCAIEKVAGKSENTEESDQDQNEVIII